MTKRPPSLDDYEREMRSRRPHRRAPAPDTAPSLTRTQTADRDTYIRRGQEAWKRHKEDATYNDWLAIAEALDIGRTEAMAEANTNQPEGSRYNKLFGEWLAGHGFDDIDKGDRSRLFDILENRAAIEGWRRTLPRAKRFAYNSPSTVWRRWQASIKPKDDAATQAKSARAKAAFGALRETKEENERLRAQVEELEAARATAPAPNLQVSEGDEVVICSFCSKSQLQTRS
jgi:hypothetical protein